MALLDRLYLDDFEICLAAQVLCEMHNGLRRKLKLPAAAASERVLRLMRFARSVATSEEVVRAACEITVIHNLQTYDAVILAAAAEAGCEKLYSEDMQNGFEWGGVTIVNPFA